MSEELPAEPMPAQKYLDMIEDAGKAFQGWEDRCRNIDSKYANLKVMAEAVGDREFQLFWANLEVLKPTIYSRPPNPVVQPRHADSGEVMRKAAEMLERVLELDVESDDLHETLKLVRDDLALSGRGAPWVIDSGECLHVDRDDFRHDPARKWKEVGWVARAAYLPREGFKERFPDVNLTRVKFDAVTGDDASEYKTSKKKAKVWEIWHRGESKVIWVTPDYPDTLDISEPLMDVKGFFPCPRPVYGTLERGTLLPVPDYVYYRDQLDEINELTARISSLSESLRLKGFYASGASEVGEAIEAAMKATDNKAILIPVSSMSALGGGSLKDAIVWLPVKEVAEVITSLVALRRQLIEDVYEITGLSDIMRGSTQASETATAQNLKAQFGSVRVRERQSEMARVARDILRIKAEIYAEKVPIQDLVAMSQMSFEPRMGPDGQPKEMATPQDIDRVLKDGKMRPFILEVESDSTIAPDEEAEKASRIEFIQAVGGFIQQAGQMVVSQPQTAPFAAEMLKFTANGFRAGRELSGAIDDFADQITQMAAQSQQGPSPQEQAAQQAAEIDAQRMAMEGEKLRMDQSKMQFEMGKMQADSEMARNQAAVSLEKTRAEVDKIEAETARIVSEIGKTDNAA